MDKVNGIINRTMTDKQEELKRKYVKEQAQNIKRDIEEIEVTEEVTEKVNRKTLVKKKKNA